MSKWHWKSTLMVGVTLTSAWQGLPASATAAEPSPVIPRQVLFGNPDRAGVQISPDGQFISFLAPVNGVLNVWVGPKDDPSKAKAVTNDTHRGIRNHFWAHTNKHVLYLQDKGGDEDWHVYCVSLDDNKIIDLTPFPKVAAQVEVVSPDFPEEILLSINDRDPKLHDVYRVSLKTAERKLVAKNEQGFAGFLADDDLKVHFAMKSMPDGSMQISKSDGKDGWSVFTSIPHADSLTTQPVALNKAQTALYMIDSRGRNTAALVEMPLTAPGQKILAQDPKADISDVIMHPRTKVVQAVRSNYDRVKWQILDPTIQKDVDYLKTVADGDFIINSRTLNDKEWIVAFVMDNGPVRYYHYDRAAGKAKFLFTNKKDLEGVQLANMRPVVIKSRDGLDLVSYNTLPPWSDSDKDGKPEKPLPMVLLVHGGPWARDSWGLNPMHQWLANRGYAVLSVNYRGSTGFGKDFINASNFEWAGKMHDDLIDAVQWAVKSGIADEKKVGIMGGSYGGYATLVGLTFTPDTFTCGVDIVGPSNLITLLSTIPPYWEPMIEIFTKRVGDHRTEEGKKLLTERSPLTRVDQIKKPLLIGQGANDPRVKQSESDQIVDAMKKKNIPVTYVLYPDEGHGFARPENRMSFYAVAEAFLAQHLSGRLEPLSEDMTGSSIQIPHGGENVPGIPKSLAKPKAAGDS